MSTQKIHAHEYTRPTYAVPTTDLVFHILAEDHVEVEAKLHIIAEKQQTTFSLDVGTDVEILNMSIDDKEVTYTRNGEQLVFTQEEQDFTLHITTKINPKKNLAYAGLYVSENILCTQNEPEGFRNIIPFFDHPDILSVYSVSIIADAKTYPVLLSNGHKQHEEISNGKKTVVFHDPFPKPSYLFALVAGDLDILSDTCPTKDGRHILLEIYMDHGNKERCIFAMDALKKSMLWDEKRFGLSCDVNEYRVVIVQAFNFGAMENKGLNIFNAKLAYADPASATDTDYQNVLAVIGHEYFHNWTGNRVTCRDWFQLTLKEGLTVFREQEFMFDMGLHELGRIQDVELLLRSQFPEDAGPNAHPIRPSSYASIDNFYTATVYEKGAEVIRMLQTIIGKKAFAEGIQEYFRRHDGTAATCEDFVQVMLSKSNAELDFEAWMAWYSACGTPTVAVKETYNPEICTLTLQCTQSLPPHHEYPNKDVLCIPFVVGLLSEMGSRLAFTYNGTPYDDSVVLLIHDRVATFVLENVQERPIVSYNRGFSAPVVVQNTHTYHDRLLLMKHDSDACSRYMSGIAIWQKELALAVAHIERGDTYVLSDEMASVFTHICMDAKDEYLLPSLMLDIPGVEILTQEMQSKQYPTIMSALDELRRQCGVTATPHLLSLVEKYQPEPVYTYAQEFVCGRRIRNTAMKFLLACMGEEGYSHAKAQYDHAHNMTDTLAALSELAHYDTPLFQTCAEDFFQKWKHDPLVMTKYFSVFGKMRRREVYTHVERIWNMAEFQNILPNHVNSLFTQGLCKNYGWFHDTEGKGYALLEHAILTVDKHNPSLGARLAKEFHEFGCIDTKQQELMKVTLERIASHTLSKDTHEIIAATLKE